jgi:hypothetical protein
LLEIWDSFSKIELFLAEFPSEVQVFEDSNVQSKNQLTQSEQRATAENDRRTHRKAAKKKHTSKPGAVSSDRDSEQPELEIEVVDGGDKDKR